MVGYLGIDDSSWVIYLGMNVALLISVAKHYEDVWLRVILVGMVAYLGIGDSLWVIDMGMNVAL